MSENGLKKQLKNLVDIRNSTVLTVFTPNSPIFPPNLLKVKELLKRKKIENIDLIIHSSGGDINTAYQIAEILRNHSKKITAIIPLLAKSAATLLTISADEIIMGELAELGPLDTQISEQKKGSRIFNSALNPFKSLEQLQTYALETLDVTAKLILSRAEMTVEEAIGHAIEFASRVTSPLFEKLDVEKLGEYSRALSVGKEYGKRLLARYNIIQNQDEILELLVRGYPSHDYIIDYKELKRLGFNVRYPSDEESSIIDAIVEYLIRTDDTDIFCLFEKDEKHQSCEKESKKRGDLNEK